MKIHLPVWALSLLVALVCFALWHGGRTVVADERLPTGPPPMKDVQVVTYGTGLTGFFDPASRTLYVYASDLKTPYMTARVNQLGKPLETKMYTPPADDHDADGERAKPKLQLDGTKVELTTMQRETRPIPGSSGTVMLKLGDITEGQVLVTVAASDGQTPLRRRSMSQGDSETFAIGEKRFILKLVELRNMLTGEDWARFTVAEAGAESD